MGGHANHQNLSIQHALKKIFKSIPSHEMVENEEWKRHRKGSVVQKAKNLVDRSIDCHAMY